MDYARLCQGLVVLPDDNGVLLAGGPERHLLRGAAVSSVIEKLLPILDGRHTVADIASEMGIAPVQALRAVSLLDRAGVLERSGGDPQEPAIAPDQVAMFLSRNVNATRAGRNAAELRAALATSSVLLVAAPPVADAIGADLRATGVGQVLALENPAEATDSRIHAVAASPRGMLAVLDDPVPGAGELERRCRQHRVPLLRFARPGNQLEIGPLFHADYTACYACFAAGYREMARPDGAGAVDGQQNLHAALVTSEILATLVRLTTPGCFRCLVTVSLPELTRQTLAVVPEPGCPECATPAGTGNEAAERAGQHEWLAERRPSELRAPRSTLEPDRAQDGFRESPTEFTTCPRLRLPDPATTPSTHGIDETVVSSLLSRLRDDAILCYLLTEPGRIGDLPGNVHRYQPAGHQLIAVRSDLHTMPSGLAGTNLPADPALVLVLVGALGRLFPRHRFAAYRLAHLAAGRMLAELSAAAPEFGLTVSLASTWDQRLVELLELRAQQELITAVVGLYPRKDRPCP
jgi:hypothetical protein